MSELYQKIEKVLSSKYISEDLNVRHAYSRNVDPILQGIPDIIVRPKDANEISEVLKIANENNQPVYIRGGGDCEFGGSKPIGDNGILLDMKRMNNILNLDRDNLIITVEAGISWGKVNDYLADFGLYTGCMGPGSGMTASIGGGISHHSVGGGGCAKYGACTNQLVSLEVVLPKGDIIETGSQANKFSKNPFNRFGNGPDLAGLFCGDNGILGVKTKISLQIFPKPKFANYKTFLLGRKSAEVSSEIFSDIRYRGIEVYDAMYIMDLLVNVGCQQGLFPMWDSLKRKRGIFFYTVQANTENELEEKTKQLDEIILNKKKVEELGTEISEGNFAKWHYVEQGHWQTYHNLWGLYPALEPLTAECFTPINTYPSILADLDQWDIENNEDIQKITEITGVRPITGSGPILLIDGSNVELTCGFTSFGPYYNGEYHEIIEEINLKLWKSVLERVTKHGVQWYMMGDMMSRMMVEIGAYPENFYEFMKSIKKTLDPNSILGRGKFHFGGS
ncbi:MAG: FAD-binding protein [Candidatus Lokiarchaeota archaeon]|nr:FAD-binding protein [Candidatus Lokiarchaeota archaeon]MBD3200798.1 FAD-binding protein [Candidatus Lokiarchaeota archaeon]